MRHDGVSRGLVSADFDGDGDLDLAITNSNGPAEVYENLNGAEQGGWLQIDLESAGPETSAIGSRVIIDTGHGRQMREHRTASSYQSQNALTVHFGLAQASGVARLDIHWPDDRQRSYRSLPANRRLRLVGGYR